MDLKKLLYKMLIKYYLSDNINAQFENFALDLRNTWASPNPHTWFLVYLFYILTVTPLRSSLSSLLLLKVSKLMH